MELTLLLPFDTLSRVAVEPLGLVSKANTWHLVARREEYIRVYRLTHLVDARVLDEEFARPPSFDLVAFWQAWCRRVEANRAHYTATIRISPEMWPLLSYYLGREVGLELVPDGQAGEQSWRTVSVVFESLEEARTHLLGCGSGIEVVAPAVLRESVADYAAQTAALYHTR